MDPATAAVCAFGVLLMVGLVWVSQAFARRARRDYERALAPLLQKYGLTVESGEPGARPGVLMRKRGRVVGDIGRYRFQMYEQVLGKTSSLQLELTGPLSSSLHIRSREGGETVEGVGRSEVAVGDPAPDERAFAKGAPIERVAHLDARARKAIAEWVALGGVIYRDRAALPAIVLQTGPLYGKAMAAMVELAEAVQAGTPDTIPGGLLRNALDDPDLGVRVLAAGILMQSFPTAEQTGRVLEAFSQSPLADLRLLVAPALGARGIEIIREIATSPDSSGKDVAAAMMAALNLPDPARASVVPVLREAASRQALRPDGVLALLLQGLADVQASAPADAVAAGLAHADPWVVRMTARCLVYAEDVESAEQYLVALLEREDPDIAIEAAVVLGRCGSVRAVEPLLAATQLGSGGLKRASRDAIQSIQGRLGDADAGRLALAEVADEGGLTLVEAAAQEPREEAATTAAAVGALVEESAPTTARR